MKNQQNFDEKLYRKNKEESLSQLLSPLSCKINWIGDSSFLRRKVTLQINQKNALGFFAEKTHDIVEIAADEALEEDIKKLIPILKNFLKSQEENLYNQIIITVFDNICDVIFCAKRKLNISQQQQLMNLSKANKFNISSLINKDLEPILQLQQNQIFYPNFKINLSGNVFIQATKKGLETITKIIRENLGNAQKVVDLYSGFGAYSFAISDLVKSVVAVEGDEKMTNLITKNAKENQLTQKISAKKLDLFSSPMLAKELNDFDLAIINPPRNGAGTQALEIAKSNLKNVIYVSCNPQSFLRDAKILIEFGFKIKNITAIDQFYKTAHLELIAIFTK